MIFLILFAIIVYLIYTRLSQYHKIWEEKKVPYEKPIPFVGNLGKNIIRIQSFEELIRNLYDEFPKSRYVGFYQLLRPTLLVKDPELIKQISIKAFETFSDRSILASEEVDPLWARNLAAMSGGPKWHDMRSTLSPSFTSSKMKIMFELMKDCAEQFSDHFLKQGVTVTVEMRDALTRFANDVIGTTAFGITCNSLENRENEFYLMGKDLTDFSGLRALKFFMYNSCPAIMKIFQIGIFPKASSSFFRQLIEDTLKVRKDKNIIRPDMINLLLEAQKGRLNYEESDSTAETGFAIVEESDLGKSQKKQKPVITDEDIAAQAIIFFLGGFDSVSTLMTFAFYELALHPEVQERLRKEVDGVLNECNGNLTYEGLMGMKYLDMVISETLRIRPPAPAADRKSTADFTIEPKLPGEVPVTLEKGTSLWIAIAGIHFDPNYHPNPEKFDPERFSDENKHKIKPFTYIPFGVGPRNCIASRFALLEAKLIVAEIISKFEIMPVERTEIPLTMDKTSFSPRASNGVWLGLKPR